MTVAGVDTTDAERIRVLFVEDEFFIREWIARSLSEQGFAVDSVTNAVDALLRIARAPIDVLLTDINLPGGMDGTVLARRARELQPNLAVIYASARAGRGACAWISVAAEALRARGRRTARCRSCARRGSRGACLTGLTPASRRAPEIPRANGCGIGRR
jgi:CheY-like chemotaxis protein